MDVSQKANKEEVAGNHACERAEVGRYAGEEEGAEGTSQFGLVVLTVKSTGVAATAARRLWVPFVRNYGL